MRDLESIYAALFARAQAVNASSTPFTTMSRRWLPWDQMNAEQSPGFFQRQPRFAVAGGDRGLPKFTLRVEWYVYLTTDPADLQTVTATPINNYATALINAILPTLQGQRQTLGGLVENAYIDGEVLIDEGLLSSPAVLLIPITILTGL
jgi:hypothetical protein